MTLWQIAIIAGISLPILWWVTRRPRAVEVRGRAYAIRVLSQAEVIKGRVR